MEHLHHHEIALAAYAIWQERTTALGPDAIPMADDDWYTAESILREKDHHHEE